MTKMFRWISRHLKTSWLHAVNTLQLHHSVHYTDGLSSVLVQTRQELEKPIHAFITSIGCFSGAA